jgi:hypothetical protein
MAIERPKQGAGECRSRNCRHLMMTLCLIVCGQH